MIVILDNSSLAKLCLFSLAENVLKRQLYTSHNQPRIAANERRRLLFIDAECQSQLYLSTIFDVTVKRYK